MADKKTVTERMYQVLVKPIVTEKSSMQAETNAITFEVARDASKPEIKEAVETIYSVKVKKVNTLTQKGKAKRFKGIMGRRSDVKKAVVYLAEGQNVDISTGI